MKPRVITLLNKPVPEAIRFDDTLLTLFDILIGGRSSCGSHSFSGPEKGEVGDAYTHFGSTGETCGIPFGASPEATAVQVLEYSMSLNSCYNHTLRPILMLIRWTSFRDMWATEAKQQMAYVQFLVSVRHIYLCT